MFGWEFPPYNSGGLGVACQGLTHALAQQDVGVCFVLPKKMDIKDEMLSFAFADDKKDILFKVLNRNLIPYPSHGMYMMRKKKIDKDSFTLDLVEEVVKYEYSAEKIAKDEDFDLIHAHDWLSMGAGVRAKQVTGKPLVVHVHATEFDRSGGEYGNQFIHDKEQEGLENADKILTVSAYTKDIIVNRYGISSDKVEVVHNGVNINELKIEENALNTAVDKLKASGKKIVLFVGRFTIQKNPEAVLHAAKKVFKFMDDVVFIFVGAGDMQEQMIETTADLGISDKVLFAGFARGAEKNHLFNSADLFIMPSISEPFGLVSLEAMATHTPVIMSRQSGVSEALQNVLKVDFWDVDEIANKTVSVLTYRSLQESLKKFGYSEVKRFSWDEAARKCVDVYADILSKKK